MPIVPALGPKDKFNISLKYVVSLKSCLPETETVIQEIFVVDSFFFWKQFLIAQTDLEFTV